MSGNNSGQGDDSSRRGNGGSKQSSSERRPHAQSSAASSRHGTPDSDLNFETLYQAWLDRNHGGVEPSDEEHERMVIEGSRPLTQLFNNLIELLDQFETGVSVSTNDGANQSTPSGSTDYAAIYSAAAAIDSRIMRGEYIEHIGRTLENLGTTGIWRNHASTRQNRVTRFNDSQNQRQPPTESPPTISADVAAELVEFSFAHFDNVATRQNGPPDLPQQFVTIAGLAHRSLRAHCEHIDRLDTMTTAELATFMGMHWNEFWAILFDHMLRLL